MLETLITSKTRIRLLIKFFVNIANKGYLNSLASEFGESTNSVRKELNNLSSAGYLQKYNEYKCSIIAIQEVPIDEISNYGNVSGQLIPNTTNTFQITDMVEKPKPENALSNMAIIGRYILTPDIFDILKNMLPDKSNEVQITDALLVQAKEGNVIAYKFKGMRFDCGSVKGYVDATNHFANKIGI